MGRKADDRSAGASGLRERFTACGLSFGEGHAAGLLACAHLGEAKLARHRWRRPHSSAACASAPERQTAPVLP